MPFQLILVVINNEHDIVFGVGNNLGTRLVFQSLCRGSIIDPRVIIQYKMCNYFYFSILKQITVFTNNVVPYWNKLLFMALRIMHSQYNTSDKQKKCSVFLPHFWCVSLSNFLPKFDLYNMWQRLSYFNFSCQGDPFRVTSTDKMLIELLWPGLVDSIRTPNLINNITLRRIIIFNVFYIKLSITYADKCSVLGNETQWWYLIVICFNDKKIYHLDSHWPILVLSQRQSKIFMVVSISILQYS